MLPLVITSNALGQIGFQQVQPALCASRQVAYVQVHLTILERARVLQVTRPQPLSQPTPPWWAASAGWPEPPGRCPPPLHQSRSRTVPVPALQPTMAARCLFITSMSVPPSAVEWALEATVSSMVPMGQLRSLRSRRARRPTQAGLVTVRPTVNSRSMGSLLQPPAHCTLNCNTFQLAGFVQG